MLFRGLSVILHGTFGGCVDGFEECARGDCGCGDAVDIASVLAHAEYCLPGISADDGARSVIGRNPGQTVLRVSKDGGDVDGITAATISSRAFLEAVNTAAEGAMQYYRQTTK